MLHILTHYAYFKHLNIPFVERYPSEMVCHHIFYLTSEIYNDALRHLKPEMAENHFCDDKFN